MLAALRSLADLLAARAVEHQTLIIVAAHGLARRGWPQGLEAAVLVVLTTAGCAASYLLVRRVGWLRPWFGLPRAMPAQPAQPAKPAR